MDQESTEGARARRGAGNAPKRKRAREDDRRPTKRHAAKPPHSGRQHTAAADAAAPEKPKSIVSDSSHPSVTLAMVGKAIADSLTSTLRIAMSIYSNEKMEGTRPDWAAYADELRASTARLRQGDLSHVEDMLI